MIPILYFIPESTHYGSGFKSMISYQQISRGKQWEKYWYKQRLFEIDSSSTGNKSKNRQMGLQQAKRIPHCIENTQERAKETTE